MCACLCVCVCCSKNTKLMGLASLDCLQKHILFYDKTLPEKSKSASLIKGGGGAYETRVVLSAMQSIYKE